MMRGLVILFALSSSWSLADVRTIEICKPESDLVREVNASARDLPVETVGQGPGPAHERRQALAQLLRDRRAVITVSDGASIDRVLADLDDDGAILSAGFRGTGPDCVTLRTGHEVWSALSSAEYAAR